MSGWDPVTVLRELWSFPFMVNAFRAGTIVAVLAGVLGWFMVLRRQSFAGHTLSVIAFPGAAGATLVGVAAGWGYFGFCLAGAAVIAAAARRGGPGAGGGYAGESALTGIVQAFGLACGFLFVALAQGFLNGLNSVLFGSFLGITATQVAVLAAVGVVTVAGLAVVGRPLLFASIDPAVAAARGVPVQLLDLLFLLGLGAAAAATAQITGTLLVFALLVLPAATAQTLTARPAASLAITVGLGVVVTWAGLTVAYYTPFPVGFYITTFAFAAYLAAQATRGLRGRGTPGRFAVGPGAEQRRGPTVMAGEP